VDTQKIPAVATVQLMARRLVRHCPRLVVSLQSWERKQLPRRTHAPRDRQDLVMQPEQPLQRASPAPVQAGTPWR
jgi:hypothetical protein